MNIPAQHYMASVAEPGIREEARRCILTKSSVINEGTYAEAQNLIIGGGTAITFFYLNKLS